MIYNYVYWIQVVFLVYACISGPIYVFVMITVAVYRSTEPIFKNSFFLLWISLGVSDLCHATVFWISSKWPLMGFLPEDFLSAGRAAAVIWMFLVFVTHINQVLGIAVLSINRLTAIVIPLKSEQIWTETYMIPACIAGSWLVSTLLSVPVLFMDMRWEYSKNISKVAFHFLSTDLSGGYMFWVGVLIATVATVIVFIYAYMFYRVRKLTIAQKKALSTQIKLATCASLVATFLAVLAICFCAFSFYTEDLLWGDNAILFFVSCDLNTFCNSYLLLATSPVVRSWCKQLFFFLIGKGKLLKRDPRSSDMEELKTSKFLTKAPLQSAPWTADLHRRTSSEDNTPMTKHALLGRFKQNKSSGDLQRLLSKNAAPFFTNTEIMMRMNGACQGICEGIQMIDRNSDDSGLQITPIFSKRSEGQKPFQHNNCIVLYS